jgi:hypothetical protein
LIGFAIGGVCGLLWGIAAVGSACIYPDPDIPCASATFVIIGAVFAGIGAFVVGMLVLIIYAVVDLITGEASKKW